MLTFALIQILVFQSLEAAKRRSVVLRQRLELVVADLAASRRRAGEAVAEVGRLAAQVAHDVNNPLAAVKVNVRWLATEGARPDQGEERDEVMVESLEAVDRIAAIVQDLKLRAREQDEALGREAAPPGTPVPQRPG